MALSLLGIDIVAVGHLLFFGSKYSQFFKSFSRLDRVGLRQLEFDMAIGGSGWSARKTRDELGGGQIKPLWSAYMDDPVVRQLLPGFAVVLQKRVAMLREAVQSSDARETSRLAHIIRGSAGSYGYAQVAEIAGRIEVEANSTWESASIFRDVTALELHAKAILLALEDIS